MISPKQSSVVRKWLRHIEESENDVCRDMYGFVVRPELVETYKSFAKIYEVEEEERSSSWESFLQRYERSTAENELLTNPEVSKDDSEECVDSSSPLETKPDSIDTSPSTQHWSKVRSSLKPLEKFLSAKVEEREEQKGKEASLKNQLDLESSRGQNLVKKIDFCDSSILESPQHKNESSNWWKIELDSLVVGGVPMALRGELWQLFVGVSYLRKEGLYAELLKDEQTLPKCNNLEEIYALIRSKESGEQFINQIEKDLQRTFPSHPALDSVGREALRNVLIAYARRNPEVGYCQGMNFLAALLLLLMPEENAFWTLTGLIDMYLEGYYSDNLVEAQVDQLVFEELVRDKFPILVGYFDQVGVQVSWVTGPWFLTMFVNVLPWDSVLRVWDVMLYEGDRSMLFRTGLAILEMHASSLMEIADPGDIMAALQGLAGHRLCFDSTKLVLSACVGYGDVKHTRLQNLRSKHRPTVHGMLRDRQINMAQYQGQRSDRLAAQAKAALAYLKQSKAEAEAAASPFSHKKPPIRKDSKTPPDPSRGSNERVLLPSLPKRSTSISAFSPQTHQSPATDVKDAGVRPGRSHSLPEEAVSRSPFASSVDRRASQGTGMGDQKDEVAVAVGAHHAQLADKQTQRSAEMGKKAAMLLTKLSREGGSVPDSEEGGACQAGTAFKGITNKKAYLISTARHPARGSQETVEELQAQIAWLKDQLLMALEGHDVAAIREKELQLALVDFCTRLEQKDEEHLKLKLDHERELEQRLSRLRGVVDDLQCQLSESGRLCRFTVEAAVTQKEAEMKAEMDNLIKDFADKEKMRHRQLQDVDSLVQQKNKQSEMLAQEVERLKSDLAASENQRLSLERQLATQRHLMKLLVAKNSECSLRLQEMEKRANTAESALGDVSRGVLSREDDASGRQP